MIYSPNMVIPIYKSFHEALDSVWKIRNFTELRQIWLIRALKIPGTSGIHEIIHMK